TAVPVRTTMFGAAIGQFALAAALTFGASLDRLVTTPSLSGWNWDAMMFCCQRYPESDAEALGKKMETIFDRDPQVQGYALGLVNAVEVGDVRGVTALGMESRKGSVTPSVVEGHLPTGPNEIMLGTETMRRAGLTVGDAVRVSGQGGTLRM